MQACDLAHPGGEPTPEGHVRPDDDARREQGAALQLELGVQIWAHHALDLLWELNEQGVCLSGGALSAPPGPVTGWLFCCAIMLQHLLGSVKKLLSKSHCQNPLSKARCQAHMQACAEHTPCCRFCHATCLNDFNEPGCSHQVLCT